MQKMQMRHVPAKSNLYSCFREYTCLHREVGKRGRIDWRENSESGRIDWRANAESRSRVMEREKATTTSVGLTTHDHIIRMEMNH